jgi:hypothetical protein
MVKADCSELGIYVKLDILGLRQNGFLQATLCNMGEAAEPESTLWGSTSMNILYICFRLNNTDYHSRLSKNFSSELDSFQLLAGAIRY